MLSLRALFIVASAFAVAVAFNPAALEGTWFMHSYVNKTSNYRESTCHTMAVSWHNGTTLEIQYSYILTNGEKVTIDYVALLETEPRITFHVLQKAKTGELSDFCTVTGLPFSKGERIGKMISNCYFDACCGSKNKIPTAVELKDLAVFCPGFSAFDNSKC